MPTPSTPARRGATATDLLSALDLMLDGPAVWGAPVRSPRPGVFVVELPEPIAEPPIDHTVLRQWLERVPTLTVDGATPTPRDLALRLGAYWLPGETVLYIGSTARSLGGRVAALVATELGDRRPFGSAYRLRTLRDVARLRVWWAETDAPEEYQDGLLEAFAAGVPAEAAATMLEASIVLPFANLQTPDGKRKQHGIRGPLNEDPTADPVTPAQRRAAAVRPTKSPAQGVRRSDGVLSAPAPRRAPARREPQEHKSGPKAKRPPTRVTASGLAAMQAELHELTTISRPAIVARIKSARELGDLRENSEYQEARREQSFAEGRIQTLEELLRHVDIIEEGATIHRVELGSAVVVDDGSAESTFRIVGPSESDPRNGRISARSPIGAAMLGHLPGDEVEVVSPAGTTRYRIVSIG